MNSFCPVVTEPSYNGVRYVSVDPSNQMNITTLTGRGGECRRGGDGRVGGSEEREGGERRVRMKWADES
eukprot:532151-Hanusia_phi.AAC.5